MKKPVLTICHFLYCHIAKPILFLFDAEAVHNRATSLGKLIGYIKPVTWVMKKATSTDVPVLTQTIGGIHFKNPMGLAAGFDYEAKLTQVLPAIGFGLGTVGTITNQSYAGNTEPRLGRLKKSQSLLVNKGFKNLGIQETLKKLEGAHFEIPIGLSIGVTNTSTLSCQDDTIRDIVEAFKVAENSTVPFSYYELNISCPNLQVNVEFYSPKNLEKLLNALTKSKLSKPLFVKMPIDKSNNEVLEMLKVIAKYPVQGVIFGNLQNDKNDPALDPSEVKRFSKGCFSGKPTEKKSNELISLTYKTYGKQLTIIGCGGVFSPEDTYRKIKLGASLVQLITGMVYEGPQLIGQINIGLLNLLKQDGFGHISEAIGTEN
ncbi:MAG: quinone-dependent dihydroorotate dehydrogenase [Patescibacteria group bacterium]|nr:quinone-dependent dihydroorotate dehydrogenase [Patescibacteria group bacterium]